MNFITNNDNNASSDQGSAKRGELQIYGLCGLARLAFSSQKQALILVEEMKCVPQILQCISNGMNVLKSFVSSKTSVDEEVHTEQEMKKINKTRTEQIKVAQLLIAKGLHVLMNLTVLYDVQHLVAQLGLKLIFHACQTVEIVQQYYLQHDNYPQQEGQEQEEEQEDKYLIAVEIQMYAERLISNVSKHPSNRTPLYKLELEWKSKALKKQQHPKKEQKTCTSETGASGQSIAMPETATTKSTVSSEKEHTLLQAKLKRIHKRRQAQMESFLNRQKLARYKDTSSYASTLKYESRFENWKKQNGHKIRPPSIFTNVIPSMQSSKKKTSFIAMRPSKSRSTQQASSTRLHSRTSSTTRSSTVAMKTRNKQRPQSAHSRTRKRSSQSGSTNTTTINTKSAVTRSTSSTLNTFSTTTKCATNRSPAAAVLDQSRLQCGLIHNMCKPIISMFGRAQERQRIHRKSKIQSAMGIATEQKEQAYHQHDPEGKDGTGRETVRLLGSTLHPVSIQVDASSSSVGTASTVVGDGSDGSGGLISSYLKPLQFVGEDDYTPWKPRIKQIRSTRQYTLAKVGDAVAPDGSVDSPQAAHSPQPPTTRSLQQRKSTSPSEKPQSPGKPPSMDALQSIKDQYIQDLQTYLIKQASTIKTTNNLLWKPMLGNAAVNLVTNPVQCTLSSTSKPFEFRLRHQYTKYQPKVVKSTRSGRSNRLGDATLLLSSGSVHKTKAANTLSTWRHCKGATVFDNTIPRYTTSDGSELYFFHSHSLHEQESPSPQPQQFPINLHDIGLLSWWHDPFPPMIHSDTSLHVRTTQNAVQLVRAVPLQLQTDVITFVVGKEVPRPLGVAKIEKPPYCPAVFLLRYASSDTESLYNFKYDALATIKRDSFELDWSRMNASDYLMQRLNERTTKNKNKTSMPPTVSKDQVLELKKACQQHYDIVMR